MKRLFLSLAILVFGAFSAIAQTGPLSADDLKPLEGSKWTGTLTYLDYRTNKKTSIRSNVTITRKADDPNVWVFAYEYPDEPKANGSSEAKLTDGGKTFSDGEVSEKKNAAGLLRIVTTKAGMDNDKNASFRYTYLIGSKSFSIKKEVRVDGSADWFERNEYSWTR